MSKNTYKILEQGWIARGSYDFDKAINPLV